MYTLGSYVVSKYAGMTYMEFVKQRIWDPLNMSTTTFYPSEAARDEKLTQVWIAGNRRIPYWDQDEQVPFNAGPGGILSSVVDVVSLECHFKCHSRHTCDLSILVQVDQNAIA